MRAATSSANLIDVHALRVGMFVHLDLGWISHPFPLNSFKITSPQQVDTIRGLGLERVRWNPEQRSSMANRNQKRHASRRRTTTCWSRSTAC